jgi:polar amino acid transport system substrate-binding protein
MWFVSAACVAFPRWASANDIAPGGTLRAVYLGSNPAQAVQDPRDRRHSGCIGRSRARNLESASMCRWSSSLPPAPKALNRRGQQRRGDIGFVAYEPSRAGTVEFSQTYMLVQQSFSCSTAQPIRAGRRYSIAPDKS